MTTLDHEPPAPTDCQRPTAAAVETHVDDHEPEQPSLLIAALDLAEVAGVRIALAHYAVPPWPSTRCSCGQSKCASPGKHPIGDGWQQRASSDPTEIKAAFAQHPAANIGIVTGLRSGVVVLDIDGPKGEATLAALEAKHGSLPLAPCVITSRGRHLYFAAGSIPLRNRQGARGRGLGPGLDLRAEGGFVIAPPSVHASGTMYDWQPGFSIGELIPPELPSWIVELAKDDDRPPPMPPPSASAPSRPLAAGRVEKWALAALERECALVRGASVGERNNVFNTAAFNLATLVGGGSLDGGTVRRQLLTAALDVGLPEHEALKTLHSAMAGGMKANTRSAPGRDLPRVNGHGVSAGAGARASAADSGSREPPDGDQLAASPASRIVFEGPDKIAEKLPEMQWICQQLQLGSGRPNMIAGYGASTKTLSAQSMLVSLAAGKSIWNRFAVDRSMVVLHLDFEQGRRDTYQRYQRIVIGLGLDWQRDIEDRLKVAVMPTVYLTDPYAHEAIAEVVVESGAELVLIDSLRAAAPGIDENASDARRQLDLLTRISDQVVQTAFTVLHHSGKPKDQHSSDARTVPRGSSALFDASGTVLTLSRKSPKKPVHVSMIKSPASAKGRPIDDFDLDVEDVAVGSDPAAGVRVVWRASTTAADVEEARQRFEERAVKVLAIVKADPDLSHRRLRQLAGLGSQVFGDLVEELVDQGRLVARSGAKGRAAKYRIGGGT